MSHVAHSKDGAHRSPHKRQRSHGAYESAAFRCRESGDGVRGGSNTQHDHRRYAGEKHFAQLGKRALAQSTTGSALAWPPHLAVANGSGRSTVLFCGFASIHNPKRRRRESGHPRIQSGERKHLRSATRCGCEEGNIRPTQVLQKSSLAVTRIMNRTGNCRRQVDMG
jgi:hypothetical protein